MLDDLVERVTDTLGNAALGLDARERLVDHGAAVHSRCVVHHGHLAGGLVDLDLGNAGHKRRRRNGQAGRGMRGERVAARDVLDAQVGKVAQREVAVLLARGALVGQAHVLAIEDHVGGVHIPHLSCLGANLLTQLGRGVLGGKARHVRTRARVRAGVERRHIGVHAAHHNERALHAQLLGGNLRQDRVDAHAVIGGAGADGNEAVLFQAHVDAGDIHVGDARALHGERAAQGAHAVAQVHGQRLVAPADHVHRTQQAAVERAGVELLVVVLRHDLALAHNVLKAQVGGVHVQHVGELVDGALHGKLALGGTVAAIRAAAVGVGVDGVPAKAARLHMVVDGQALVARKADRRGGMLTIGAGVGQRVQVDGRDGAVVHGAQLNGHLHLVARVARGDGLLAGVAAVARTAGLLRHERHEDLAAARLLGAKAATDTRFDDLYLRLRNVERLRDHAAHVEGHLRRGGHRDTSKSVGRREGAEGLHGRGLRGLAGVGAGKDDVTLGERLIKIAKIAGTAAHQVASNVAALREHKGHVALGVDHDVVIERLGKVEQGLEHLVIDLNELERLVGGLLGLGGDDRHLLVLIAHEVLEDQAVVGTRLRIALAGDGKAALGHVLVGVDAHDAGHLQGARRIDGADLGAGIRAALEFDDERAGGHQVARVDGTSLEQGLRVLFRLLMGDLLVGDTVAAGVVDRQLGHLKANLHAGLIEKAHDGAQLALVATAAAEVAGELARELLARGNEAWVLLGGAGKRQHVHDEAGGAKTALLGTFGSHRAGERLGLGLEALERGNGAALDARGGNRAAQHRVAVEPHRAQAAVGGLAGAAHRRAALLAQKRKEHGIGGDLNLDLAAVERKGKIDEFGSH